MAQLAAAELQRLQRAGECGALRARFAHAANRPEQYSGSTARNAVHRHHTRTDRQAVKGVHCTRGAANRGQSRPTRLIGDNHDPLLAVVLLYVVSWSGEHMKALSLGHFAAIVASRILAKVKPPRAAMGAVPIYLLDAALASAFVARSCAGMMWFSSSRSILAQPVPRLESRSSNGCRRRTVFSSTHRSDRGQSWSGLLRYSHSCRAVRLGR